MPANIREPKSEGIRLNKIQNPIIESIISLDKTF